MLIRADTGACHFVRARPLAFTRTDGDAYTTTVGGAGEELVHDTHGHVRERWCARQLATCVTDCPPSLRIKHDAKSSTDQHEADDIETFHLKGLEVEQKTRRKVCKSWAYVRSMMPVASKNLFFELPPSLSHCVIVYSRYSPVCSGACNVPNLTNDGILVEHGNLVGYHT